MPGAKILKRSDMKDTDFIFLHRESGGYGSPRVIDSIQKRFAMRARDFLSDIPTDPIMNTGCLNSGVTTTLFRPVAYAAGQPVVAAVDRIVTTTIMLVGAYTIANASAAGGVALNVTVTVTQDTEDDTEGTLDIVGTDIDDQVLLETLTPLIGSTIQGTRAFKTVTSVTGVGWIDGGTPDTITVGFGELIGLPDYMPHDRVLFAMLNNVREGTHPTVTSSETVLALNTVDLSTALGGTVVVIYYLV